MNIKKIIACGIIIAACYFAGIIYGEYKKRSYNELCGMLSLVIFIRSKISYTRTAIFDIMSEFQDNALEACGFLKYFKSHTGESINLLWETACSSLSLNDKILTEIKLLGSSLGLLDTETQLQRLAACESFLTNEKIEIEKLFTKRIKSYRSLGALGGAMLAIILY
ncbi:stage III sporulation protein AB [Eubacteriales bacterium OttesenSCG-928-G02]|nr:stage III sporulation protein AB [Eubacteriales bacterium OttesenSCG-928-G02]